MALHYVTLILDAYDATGAYLTGGSAVIAPNSVLTDPTDQEWVPPAPVPVPFSLYAATPSVKLLATDNANITPSGWAYTIQFLAVPGNPAGFSFFLPFSSGATQRLSAIVPAIASPPALFAYLPLPTGTATAGYAPIATGSGELSAWGPAANLNSPAFTGTPTAPTNANSADATTQLATDAFVQNAVNAALVSYYGKFVDGSGLWAPRAEVRDIPVEGSLSVGATLSGPIVTTTYTLHHVWAVVGTLSFGGSVTIDILIGGQSVFPNPANLLVISDCDMTYVAKSGTLNFAVTSDANIQVHVTAISGTATDLHVSAFFNVA